MGLTDFESQVLDELYFIRSFKELLEELGCESEYLRNTLMNMLEKNWVKLFYEEELIDDPDLINFNYSFDSLKFNASKLGLKIHNGMN